jgi:hypothetical protein
VTVTGLPTDGYVLMSDGVTPVTNGEILTIAQLMVKPTAGVSGESSSFTYSVSDPNGVTAAGTATLAIGLDTMPRVTTTALLTVAENAAATAIGITAPTDPDYSASELSVTVTGLPTDGTVLLSDRVTAVTNGEILTVAQLTGLLFKLTAGAFGRNSSDGVHRPSPAPIGRLEASGRARRPFSPGFPHARDAAPVAGFPRCLPVVIGRPSTP